MAIEDTEHAIALGRQAQQFLDSELFQEVLKGCEETFTARWRESKIEDEKTRDTAYFCLHALAEVEHQLRVLASNGICEQEKARRRDQGRN